MEFLARVSRPGISVVARLAAAIWRQAALTPVNPPAPRLDGEVALVTGGSAGIGLHIARELAMRGAEVVIAARSIETARAVATGLTTETSARAHAVRLDLADLHSVRACTGQLAGILDGRRLQRFVLNAGVWPRRHASSAQGHEIAFATNVLGHFALSRQLQRQDLLASDARVVIQTGDIYIMADGCTADFSYRGAYGGLLAYCRSKLGNLWFARELQRRYPSLQVAIAHPGVVASNLVSLGGGIGRRIQRLLLLDPQAGAQTALVLTCQPGIGRGVYYHNTGGRMDLAADDPAMNTAAAARLWDLLETLAPPD